MSIDCSKKTEFYKRFKSRKHASFFHNDDTIITELYVVSTFLKNVEINGEKTLSCNTIPNDPPDIRIETNLRTIGIEIVELVNQKAIEIERENFYNLNEDLKISMDDSQKYETELYKFSINYTKKLDDIIKSKNDKCKNIINTFDSVILLIHSDEECVNYYKIKEECNIKDNNFHEIYLLQSPGKVFRLK